MAYLPSQQIYKITVPSLALTTSASPLNGSLVTLPPEISRYIVLSATIEALSAAGSLALAVINVQSGAGTVLVNGATLTALTATDTVQILTPVALASICSDNTIRLRQTTNSAFAGTVQCVLTILALP